MSEEARCVLNMLCYSKHNDEVNPGLLIGLASGMFGDSVKILELKKHKFIMGADNLHRVINSVLHSICYQSGGFQNFRLMHLFHDQ